MCAIIREQMWIQQSEMILIKADYSMLKKADPELRLVLRNIKFAPYVTNNRLEILCMTKAIIRNMVDGNMEIHITGEVRSLLDSEMLYPWEWS